jgi:hypothetical protein
MPPAIPVAGNLARCANDPIVEALRTRSLDPAIAEFRMGAERALQAKAGLWSSQLFFSALNFAHLAR